MKNKKLHNIKKTGFKTPDTYFDSLEDKIINKLNDGKSLEDIKEAGFKVPDNYFESLEDNVMNKLDNTSSSLEKIKNTGFKVPDNYFETIENKLAQHLPQQKQTQVVQLFSKRNVLYVSGMAPAILIMFGIFMNRTDKGFDSFDMEVVESYLEQQDLSTYEIASLLTEEDLMHDDFDIINDTFSDESLEDYLIENANLEDIIEQ